MRLEMTLLLVVLMGCTKSAAQESLQLDAGDEEPVRMIKEEGYPVETHLVDTDDGYVLTVHRIPPTNWEQSIPVFLQHGFLSSTTDWILSGKNESLAYFLHDHGYDVWIGNARGNTYSRRHRTLSPVLDDAEHFWNFSFHEQGVYDVAAVVQYVANATNSSLFYVGHSMGCSSFAIMASEKPELAARNVKAMIAMAPAAYEFNIKQRALKFLSRNWRAIWYLADSAGVYEFLPRNFFFNFVAKRICTLPLNIGPTICRKLVHVLEGSNPRGFLTPLIWGSFPAGTSVKGFTHWLQQMDSNEFRQFDYGRRVNTKVYGSATPPGYDLTKIQVPMAVIYAENDILTTSKDVRHFYTKLPVKLGLYEVPERSYGHADFMWGFNNTELINKQVLKIIESVA